MKVERVVTCAEHGEVINDEPCKECHAQDKHDNLCVYLGNDAWNCGKIDNSGE